MTRLTAPIFLIAFLAAGYSLAADETALAAAMPERAIVLLAVGAVLAAILACMAIVTHRNIGRRTTK